MIPIKTGKEIEKMRQACRTASEILDRVSELIRPGISTKEVDEAAADLMQEATRATSAFLRDPNGQIFPGNIVHLHSMTDSAGMRQPPAIQYVVIVKLDIGVIGRTAGMGDTASTVPVGMIEERTERLLRVTQAALRPRSRPRPKGWGSRMFVRRSKRWRCAMDLPSCASSSATACGQKLHKSRKVPNFRESAERPALKSWHDPGARADD